MSEFNSLKMLAAIGSQAREFNAQAWGDLLSFCVNSLSKSFGGPIELDQSTGGPCIGEFNEGGFSQDLFWRGSSAQRILSWRGILGASILDDRIRVSVTVFFYSGDRRLIAAGGDEFVEYVCDVENGVEAWKQAGWYKDEYKEYGTFD